MTEPLSAFLKLTIDRPDLVRWLDAPTPDPARWSDWRDIGGEWYLSADRSLATISEAELSESCEAAGSILGVGNSWGIHNRAALRRLLHGSPPECCRIAYDAETRTFLAGTLLFDENLYSFLAFLTLARGAADCLGLEGRGVAVINDYVFGPAEDATAALELGPAGRSRLLPQGSRGDAVAVFQPLANELMTETDDPPDPVDQLDELR
ncbi:MAG: hypothetical protein PGN34_02905 [Methylobacterium frigidaeris]